MAALRRRGVQAGERAHSESAATADESSKLHDLGIYTLVVSLSNHEPAARPSTVREPQDRLEQGREATSSGRAGFL
jgi:hypothetical protein